MTDPDLLITCPLCGGGGTIEDPRAEDPVACSLCPLCRGAGRTTRAKVRRMAQEKGADT
jgi:DnaJ-class molecular chaperone